MSGHLEHPAGHDEVRIGEPVPAERPATVRRPDPGPLVRVAVGPEGDRRQRVARLHSNELDGRPDGRAARARGHATGDLRRSGDVGNGLGRGRATGRSRSWRAGSRRRLRRLGVGGQAKGPAGSQQLGARKEHHTGGHLPTAVQPLDLPPPLTRAQRHLGDRPERVPWPHPPDRSAGRHRCSRRGRARPRRTWPGGGATVAAAGRSDPKALSSAAAAVTSAAATMRLPPRPRTRPSWRWRTTATTSIATLSTNWNQAIQMTTATAFTITSAGTPSRVRASPIACGEGTWLGNGQPAAFTSRSGTPIDQPDEGEQGGDALEDADESTHVPCSDRAVAVADTVRLPTPASRSSTIDCLVVAVTVIERSDTSTEPVAPAAAEHLASRGLGAGGVEGEARRPGSRPLAGRRLVPRSPPRRPSGAGRPRCGRRRAPARPRAGRPG